MTYGDGSINAENFDFLRKFIKQNSIKSVLEFGPGTSTLCFLACGCDVDTCECKESYFHQYKNEFRGNTKINVHVYDDVDNVSVPSLEKDRYDMAFIDGPVGRARLSRLNTLLFSASKTDIIMLHDAARKGELESIDEMRKLGWKSFRFDNLALIVK
jgi:predicted O-methyltransferase YrrM